MANLQDSASYDSCGGNRPVTANSTLESAIRDVDVNRLTERLRRYAQKRCAQLIWRGERGGPILGGREIGDLAHDGLLRALERIHEWSPEGGPLEDFLYVRSCGAIRGQAGHLARSAENRTTGRLGDRELQVPEADPALPIEHREQAELLRRVLRCLDDPIARRIVSAVLGHEDVTATEIASEFGVSREDVYVAKRRLKRNQDLRQLLIVSGTNV
jgi:RNA polymerase sigma factor (sigma-70 family)